MPQGFIALGQEVSVNAVFWWHNSGWAAKFARWMPTKVAQQDTKGWDGKGAPPHTAPDPEPQEKHEDRVRKVARVEISPRDVTIHTGEKIVFAVVAYDKDGSLVTGMSVKWEGSDDDKKRAQRVSPQGEFSSPVPGKYKITADISGRKDSVKVIVIGDALNPNDKGVKGDPISTKDAPKEKVSLAPQERIRGVSAPASSESSALRRTASQLSQASRSGLQAAAKPMAVAAAAFQSGYDYYTWNGGNYTTADDPGKEVGQMPGHALDGGAGSGNFQFAAPIIGLDGRGINVNLTMTYNSRVWHKSGTDMYFDVDGDWQPGWTMGFGRIVTAGNGYMLIDGDGTRHSFSGNPWSYSAPNTSLQGFDGYTTDGTFINYYARGYRPQYGSYILNAWAKLPNGTTITYGASANLGAYPTQITDANGNYLTITYKSNQGPNIDTITDTLGRQIKFYYDSSNLMTTITAPGFAGGGERVVARFLYDSAYLSDAGANYGFSGVNCRVKSNLINRIKAIYYPANNTGYWFGDSDSYSKYGMLRKISERRRMACSNCTNSLSDMTVQPNLTDTGVMSREMVYSSGGQPGYDSYGSTPPSGLLTDSPTYTQMTEDWYGRQTASAPVTTYSVQDLGSTRKTRITRPDGVTSEQITDNVTTSQTYGLMLEDKSYATASSTTPQQSSKVYWEVPNFNSYPTCDGAPRPNHTEVTDERGQMTSTYYTYVNLYNQVSDVSEYGYNGQLLRRTHKDYINTTPYVGYWSNNAYGSYFGRHIFNLVSAVEVYGPDNTTRVSRTEYQYDQQLGQSLISTPSVTQHQRASDPYDPGDTYCDWVWNEQTYTYDYVCNTYPVYDSGTDYRGNVTSVKSYADAVGLNASTAVSETRNYDICGNVRITSTACCDQTSFSYN